MLHRSLFGLLQAFFIVLREVSASEGRIIRKAHLKGFVRVPASYSFSDAATQYMSAHDFIITEKMEMVSRNIDSLDVGRGTKADQCSGDIPEFEDRFGFHDLGKRSVGFVLF